MIGAVVVTGRTSKGRVGVVLGPDHKRADRLVVRFPEQQFPRDVRSIARVNLRVATLAEEYAL